MIKTWIYRYIAVYLLVSGWQSAAVEQDCVALKQPPQHGLNGAQIKALSDAKDHYEVRTLVKEINGRSRTVVLLGETHIKSAISYELGNIILNEFHNRGLEEVVLANYWAPKLLAAAGDFKRTKKMPKGSSIDSAQLDAVMAEFEEGLVDDLAADIANGTKTKDAMIDELIQILATDRETESLNPRQSKASPLKYQKVDWTRVLQLLLTKLGDMDLTPYARPAIQDFKLENNHKPGFYEKLSVLAWSVGHQALRYVVAPTLSAAGLSLGLLAFTQDAEYGQFLIRVANGSMLTALVPMVLNVGGMYGTFYYGTRKRDLTMIANVINILETDDEMDVLLVIVGRYHVNNQTRLLLSQGFAVVPTK